jgi:hypothetical protein
MRISMAIMEQNGVEVGFVRVVDHDLVPGVWPDMREHGAANGRPSTGGYGEQTSSYSA